jgi:SAM-dependent methyltransferase
MRYQTLEQFLEFKQKLDVEGIYDMGGNSKSYRDYQKYDLSRLFKNKITTVDLIDDEGVDIVDDLEKLTKISDNSVGSIICSDVLEHVKNPFNVINSFERVLKPGAWIYLSTIFMYPIHGALDKDKNVIDYWRFTPLCLRNLFSNFNIYRTDLQKGNGDTRLQFNRFKKGVFILASKK